MYAVTIISRPVRPYPNASRREATPAARTTCPAARLGCFAVALAALMALLPADLRAQAGEEPPAVELGVAYTGELWGNVSGGLKRGLRYLDNVDITAEADLQRLAGWRNAGIFLYGMGNQGGNLSSLVGDVQTVSNIEAQNSWRLYEAWLEQRLPGAGLSLLGGLYDLNSEFNVLPSAQLFINSSHGIGAAMASSGVTGPSIFPLTSLGTRLKARLLPGLHVLAAALDGVPSSPGNTRGTKIYLRPDDGLLLTGEIVLLGEGSGEPLPSEGSLRRNAGHESDHKVAAGGWYYTRERGTLMGPTELSGRSKGAYLIAETLIWAAGGGERRLSLFGRMEVANGEVNPVTGFFGAGAVYRGAFRSDGSDRLGLAVAHAIRSPDYAHLYLDDPRRETDAGAETNFELTYLAPLGDHLELQFNSQYILNPGWYGEVGHAWVNGLRLVLSI